MRTALETLVRKNFSLTPKGIIESLNLRKPIFEGDRGLWAFLAAQASGFKWEADGQRPLRWREQAGVKVAAK